MTSYRLPSSGKSARSAASHTLSADGIPIDLTPLGFADRARMRRGYHARSLARHQTNAPCAELTLGARAESRSLRSTVQRHERPGVDLAIGRAIEHHPETKRNREIGPTAPGHQDRYALRDEHGPKRSAR